MPTKSPFEYHGVNAFFSPDGDILIANGLSGDVLFWKVATGELVYSVKERNSVFTSAASSYDSKILALGGKGRLIRLIEFSGKKLIREIEGPNPAPHPNANPNAIFEGVSGFVFSPNGQLFAATNDDSIFVWDAQTGKPRYKIKVGHCQLGFSPDSKFLVSSGHYEMRIYAAANGELLRKCNQQMEWFGIRPVFSPDSKTIAIVHDYATSLWDVSSGKRLLNFPGHDSPVRMLRFSPDGTCLASAGLDSFTVWDLASRKPRYSCPGHILQVSSLSYSRDGKWIASGDGGAMNGGMEAYIRLWSAADGQLIREWPAHLNSIGSLDFSPDGKTLVSTGFDARLKLWEASTGKRLRQFRSANNIYNSASISFDGKNLLIAGFDDELALWQIDSGQKLRVFGKLSPMSFGATYHPNGKLLLALGREEEQQTRDDGMPGMAGMIPGIPKQFCTIRVWDSDGGQLLRSTKIAMEQLQFRGVGLSPDGKLLAVSGNPAANSDNKEDVELWDSVSGKKVGRFQGQPGSTAGTFAFSPDGKLLAVAATDTTIVIWPIAFGRLHHLWTELLAEKNDFAQSLKKLAGSAPESLPFLQERLQKAAALEVRLRHELAELDHDSFRRREKAQQELKNLWPDSRSFLQEALQQSPSVEVKSRIDSIFADMETSAKSVKTFDQRSTQLALGLIEEIGGAEAQRILQNLAKGPPNSNITREAQAMLLRLAKPPKGP